jgi:hypothetical protein
MNLFVTNSKSKKCQSKEKLLVITNEYDENYVPSKMEKQICEGKRFHWLVRKTSLKYLYCSIDGA